MTPLLLFLGPGSGLRTLARSLDGSRAVYVAMTPEYSTLYLGLPSYILGALHALVYLPAKLSFSRRRGGGDPSLLNARIRSYIRTISVQVE